MDIKGAIGSSPISYDVAVGSDLSLTLSIVYQDPSPTGCSASVSAKVPAAAILDALAAKLNSPIATEVEQGLLAAIKLYVAAQPSA